MELNKARQGRKELEWVCSCVQDSINNAEYRLVGLKAELPKALAQLTLDVFLGRLEKEGEVKRIKAEIAEHEETLKDAPLALEELERIPHGDLF